MSSKSTNQKRVKTTNLLQNKENISVMNIASVTCKKETNVAFAQSSQSITFSKSSTTVTKKKHTTATMSSESESTRSSGVLQRKLTYEVLTPEKCLPRRSLRSKAISAVMEIEKEKQLFETIASPGLLNESLEKAASQLIEIENPYSNAVFPNVTFALHDPVTATPFRRETYEVLTPFNRQTTIGERLAQAERSAWRASLGSRDGSESLEDSLEIADKTSNKDKLFDNLDRFDLDSVSMSPKENNSATSPTVEFEGIKFKPVAEKKRESSLTPQVLLMDVKSLENMSLDWTKTVHLNETINKETDEQVEVGDVTHIIVHEVTEQHSQEVCVEYTTREERKCPDRFSSNTRYSDSLNSETSKEYMTKLMEIDSLDFSVSSSRRSSELANSPSYSTKETFVLRNDSSTTKESVINLEKCVKKPVDDHLDHFEQKRTETEKCYENNPNNQLLQLEKELLLSPIQHQSVVSSDFKPTFVESLAIKQEVISPKDHSAVLSNSFQHSSMIDIGSIGASAPSFSNISELKSDNESKLQIEICELTPIESKIEVHNWIEQADLHNQDFYSSSTIQEPKCSFKKESPCFSQPKIDSIEFSGISMTSQPVSENLQLNASDDTSRVKIEKEQAWDVSPPKKSKQDNENLERCSNQMPRVKSSLLTGGLANPLSVSGSGRSSLKPSISVNENNETPFIVRGMVASSSGIFAVPTLAVKRPLKTRLSSNNSPPKLRKVEVKRLSCTPNLQRKSSFITPSKFKNYSLAYILILGSLS